MAQGLQLHPQWQPDGYGTGDGSQSFEFAPGEEDGKKNGEQAPRVEDQKTCVGGERHGYSAPFF